MLIHQTYMEVGHGQVGWLPLDYLSDAELLLDGWMLDHAGLDQGDEVVGAPVHLHSTVQYSTPDIGHGSHQPRPAPHLQRRGEAEHDWDGDQRHQVQTLKRGHY